MPGSLENSVLKAVDESLEESVEFLQEMVRIPTVNPPGDNYVACAELIGKKLGEFGYDVRSIKTSGLEECTSEHPRVNTLGSLTGSVGGPLLHFNGHIDVVPAGNGWTRPPFEAQISGGRMYGRGTADQKSGIAASIFAVEAIRRAGVKLGGTVEQSATVDEESGGQAGVAYLARNGYLNRERIDYVIITEPLDHDRICLGHRGVYWFELTVRGRTAHGSMPFLGVSAIDRMARIVEKIERELKPELRTRVTAMPVEPPEARQASINVNSIAGGQPLDGLQTPCVADTCQAILDRRFLMEESAEDVRHELMGHIETLRREDPDLEYELRDMMLVHPTMTAAESRLVREMRQAIGEVMEYEPAMIASPGTYDQKHFARIAGIEQCIAYGPGILDLAHQPDEYVEIEHLRLATRAMALATMRLLGT